MTALDTTPHPRSADTRPADPDPAHTEPSSGAVVGDTPKPDVASNTDPGRPRWAVAATAAFASLLLVAVAGGTIGAAVTAWVQAFGIIGLLTSSGALRRGRATEIIIGSAALTGVGLALSDTNTTGPVATALVAWAAVLLLTGRASRSGRSVDLTDGRAEGSPVATEVSPLLSGSPPTLLLALASFVGCIAAVAIPGLAPAALALAVAAPAVVAVLAVLLSPGTGRPGTNAALLAFPVAIVAGLLATSAQADAVSRVAMVGVAAVVVVSALLLWPSGRLLLDSRTGIDIGPRVLPGDAIAAVVGGFALVGTGLGAGLPATIAVVGTLAFVSLPSRSTTTPALPAHADPDADDMDRQPRTSRAVLIVSGATAVAFLLRLATPRGLWLDELTQYSQSRLGLTDMLGILYREDNHPPLYYMVQWVSVRLLGNSELALRLPSMLFGTLLVPLLYVVGRDLYDRRVGVAAAVLGAVAPVAIWYGQEARMYALFMLLALLGVWAVVRIVRGDSSWWWAVLVAANTGVVLTQWFAILHLIALNVVLLGIVWARRRIPAGRRLARNWAISLFVQVLCLAPALPLALHQFAGNQERGLGFASDRLASRSDIVPPPSVYTALTNLEWALFGYQSDRVTRGLVALWPVAMLAVLMLMGRVRRPANRYLAVVVIVPALGMYAASLLASNGRSLAEVRYFAGAVPALLLLIAAALTSVLTTRRAQFVVGSAVVVAMLAGTLGQIVEQDNPRRYGYREALTEVAERARPGDELLYAPFFMDVVVSYYSPALPVTSLEEQPLPDGLDGTVYVLLSPGFADTGDGAVRAERRLEQLRADHELVDVIRAPNVEIEVYEGADS